MSYNPDPPETALDHLKDFLGLRGRQSGAEPWITRIFIFACLGVFLMISADTSDNALEKWGYADAFRIYGGAYWALFAPIWIHQNFWHVAFNVYWLWVLGRHLESSIGSLRYLAFCLAAAFVTSSTELAAFGDTGIGASGVGYAIFGFAWVARNKYPALSEIVDKRLVKLFLGWLVLCIAATAAHVMNIANGAHVSGLLFGVTVAACFAVRQRLKWAVPGLCLMVVCSSIFLFWCPWSTEWLSHQAYADHKSGHYVEAIKLYTRVIERSPDDPWAYGNRSMAYASHGDYMKAWADNLKAQQLQEGSKTDNAPDDNSKAWTDYLKTQKISKETK